MTFDELMKQLAPITESKGLKERVKDQKARFQRERQEAKGKVARVLKDTTRTDSYRREERQRIEQEAQQVVAVAMKESSIAAEVARHLATRDQWTPENVVKRITRFTTGPAVEEKLTELTWRLNARELSPAELKDAFQAELSQEHYAVVGLLLRESERRHAAAPDATQTAARVLVKEMKEALNADPKLTIPTRVFEELASENESLMSAFTALTTGDDPMMRQDAIQRFRREGLSNDEINQRMATVNAQSME
jgi:hypothetical protein